MYQKIYHEEDLSNFSFLVTGGAGFIGNNIVEYLLQYNAGKVRVLDNFSTGSHDNLVPFRSNPAFELIEGDIRDLNICRQSVTGIDFISHQAALGSVPRSINDPITSNEVNVSGFLNMLVAARDENVKRFVYAASSSTYGDHPALPKVEDHIGKPLSPYAVTKYVNELYSDVFSKTYDFHTVGLRYFNVFGPRQNPNGPYAAVIPLFFSAALQNERPVINGDGENTRDFTFVENVVQSNIKALFSEIEYHQIFNIAYGEQISLNMLWKNVTALTEKNIQPIYGPPRKGDIKHSLANIEKARNVLKYNPSIDIEAGLFECFEWYKNKFSGQ